MTAEHVPPRSTGNEAPVGLVLDPLDPKSIVQQVAEWDEGHVVSTLCPSCNQRASDWGYVQEYRRWVEHCVAETKAVATKTGADPLRDTQPFQIELPYDVHPARFVRQALGMFLAVQHEEHLFADHTVLPDLIGPEPSDAAKRRVDGLDISPLHLYASVYNGNWRYGTQPMLSIETRFGPASDLLWTPPSASSQSDDFRILCLTPFVFVLGTATASDLGHDISHWAHWSVDQRLTRAERQIALPTADQLQGALRAMVYPAKYIVP